MKAKCIATGQGVCWAQDHLGNLYTRKSLGARRLGAEIDADHKDQRLAQEVLSGRPLARCIAKYRGINEAIGAHGVTNVNLYTEEAQEAGAKMIQQVLAAKLSA